MYICGINYESILEASGVSCVIYISGCKHNCKGCHSPNTHNFNSGILCTDELISEINNNIMKRPFVKTLVLCGGDPMYSAKELVDEWLPKLFIPNNGIWCYTGFLMEEIQKDKYMNNLKDKCNVIIDGKFDIELRDTTLNYRGSLNQNIWVKSGSNWYINNNL